MSTPATTEAPSTADAPEKRTVPQLGRRAALRKLFVAAGAGTVDLQFDGRRPSTSSPVNSGGSYR
jgi:hypothetical protein